MQIKSDRKDFGANIITNISPK